MEHKFRVTFEVWGVRISICNFFFREQLLRDEVEKFLEGLSRTKKGLLNGGL